MRIIRGTVVIGALFAGILVTSQTALAGTFEELRRTVADWIRPEQKLASPGTPKRIAQDYESKKIAQARIKGKQYEQNILAEQCAVNQEIYRRAAKRTRILEEDQADVCSALPYSD